MSACFRCDVKKLSPLTLFVDWNLVAHSQEQGLGKLGLGAALSFMLCSLLSSLTCFSGDFKGKKGSFLLLMKSHLDFDNL